MDDQRADRKSSRLVRLLLALSIIPVGLLCIYLVTIANLGIYMAYRNFDPEMAIYFAAATMGFIVGVGATVAFTQVLRRNKVRITHFRLRDLFVAMTMLAIILGLMSYVLNKT